MSIRALQEYTRFAKYAKFVPNLKRRETWDEQVARVFDMHRKKLGPEICEKLKEDLEFAERMMRTKRVLGSQRALQFGGDPILKKMARLYNCSASYVDRPRFFQECIYMLLCGCGVGFSVQKHHIDRLPNIKARSSETVTYVIPDSIEGWSDAIGILMSSYFEGDDVPFKEYQNKTVEFDYSLIRPEGSLLSSGGKAPGPEGLKRTINKITYLMDKSCKYKTRLETIDAYDVIMHCCDAVLSGGIRRSAALCLFSHDDEKMMKAKTGSWHLDNPQRGRSNNSALLIRDEISKEQFMSLFENVKEFGEPGFIFADDRDSLFNPCVEINIVPKLQKIVNNIVKEISGWGFCNLCEINVKKAKTKEEFYEMCRAAAIIGTIQASYAEFPYLGEISEEIVKKEALLGVSMTGMADNPEIAFDAKIQRDGAKMVLDTNERIAKIIGINSCARSTCIKPAGSTSCLLGTASGIHPHHAKRYIRRVQANKLETPLQYFQKFNPQAIEPSVWSNNGTDMVISFLCEVPDGAKTKNQVDAISLLENVKNTQQNWVEYGTRHDQTAWKWARQNVSNTISVKPEEWDKVADYIFKNKKWFAGISLLPISGDKDYPQSPFTAVLTPTELISEYGDGCVFASGLIVDGMRAFDNNLWAACDCVLGIGETITVDALRIKIEKAFETNGEKWKAEGLSPKSPEKLLLAWLEHNVKNYRDKIDWIRRAKQFAERYFKGNDRDMTYCLKDVANWKTWCDLKRVYKDVDWSGCFEDSYGNLEEYGGGAGESCQGGACETGLLGAVIKEKQRKQKEKM